MTTRDENSVLRRRSLTAGVALSAAAVLASLLAATPAEAEIRPVPQASGYDYSAGEPAL
jgi:hypothetical protein